MKVLTFFTLMKHESKDGTEQNKTNHGRMDVKKNKPVINITVSLIKNLPIHGHPKFPILLSSLLFFFLFSFIITIIEILYYQPIHKLYSKNAYFITERKQQGQPKHPLGNQLGRIELQPYPWIGHRR